MSSFIWEQTEVEDYCVYWFRKATDTDMMTQGYVGITKNFHTRMRQHRTRLNILMLETDIDIISEVIAFGTKNECLALEKKYRPKRNIGWNQESGGGGVKHGNHVGSIKGRKPSKGALLLGENRSESQKAASKAHSERMKGRTPWNKKL